MGEAFKRARAAAFDHQSHRRYQALIERDLLRIARPTEIRHELTGRLTNSSTALAVGAHCLVRESEQGNYEVLHGNIVVAALATEARAVLSVYEQLAPSFNGILPCRVTRIGAFGGISFEVDAGASDEE